MKILLDFVPVSYLDFINKTLKEEYINHTYNCRKSYVHNVTTYNNFCVLTIYNVDKEWIMEYEYLDNGHANKDWKLLLKLLADEFYELEESEWNGIPILAIPKVFFLTDGTWITNYRDIHPITGDKLDEE